MYFNVSIFFQLQSFECFFSVFQRISAISPDMFTNMSLVPQNHGKKGVKHKWKMLILGQTSLLKPHCQCFRKRSTFTPIGYVWDVFFPRFLLGFPSLFRNVKTFGRIAKELAWQHRRHWICHQKLAPGRGQAINKSTSLIKSSRI